MYIEDLIVTKELKQQKNEILALKQNLTTLKQEVNKDAY